MIDKEWLERDIFLFPGLTFNDLQRFFEDKDLFKEYLSSLIREEKVYLLGNKCYHQSYVQKGLDI